MNQTPVAGTFKLLVCFWICLGFEQSVPTLYPLLWLAKQLWARVFLLIFNLTIRLKLKVIRYVS